MKIQGNIEVYNGNKIISKGTNLITNIGKEIFFDWFLHNSYQNNLSNKYNGLSLSDENFVSSEKMSFTFNGNINDKLKTFWNTSQSQSVTYQNLGNSSTLLIDFTDSSINLSGILINANKSSGYTDDAIYRVKIYASIYSSAYAQKYSQWTFYKVAILNNAISSSLNNAKVIRMDNIYTTDGYLNNIKSVKICFNSNSSNFALNGVGILEKKPFKNIPCAIGLGTSDNSPTVSDTSLNNLYGKFFINKQYCTIQNTNNQQSTNVKSIFNINAALINSISAYNKVNIIYASRLSYGQCNEVTFKQIGLFYPSNNLLMSGGANNCDLLFSHGLMTSWKKTKNQIIDVKYIISITV